MTIVDQLMQEEYDSWGMHPPEHAWCTPEQTRLEVEFLRRALSLSKTDAILDLQCSWGRHALILGPEGYIRRRESPLTTPVNSRSMITVQPGKRRLSVMPGLPLLQCTTGTVLMNLTIKVDLV